MTDVTCDVCGLPTDEPTITSDNRFLCPECNLLCRKCWGEGTGCLHCEGKGLEPSLDEDADIFG